MPRKSQRSLSEQPQPKADRGDLTAGGPTTGSIRDYISGLEVRVSPEEVNAVQVFSRRLVEDFGYPKSHIQTRPQFRVKRRPSDTKKSYPVDIAVFSKPRKTDDDLLIVVECKAPTKQEGRRQLEDYLTLSAAQIGVWFNGDSHLYLRKDYVKDGKVIFSSIPTIPRHGQRIQDIGLYLRKDLRATEQLKSVLRDLRNHLAGNVTGITRDEPLAQQIINLLFCKVFDEIRKGPDEMVDFRAGVDEDIEQVRARILDLFADVRGCPVRC